MIIDAGQKKFGAQQCKLCGMVYSSSDPGDNKQHNYYHQRFTDALKFPGLSYDKKLTYCLYLAA